MAKVNKQNVFSVSKNKPEPNKNSKKKMKSGQTISLNKKDQKKVVKETKKLQNKIKEGTVVLDRKTRKLDAEEKRGLVYIGHIPHGFYEEQMRNYFKQFGKVTNVQVCRSCKTGNSKGYGYIEFAHPEVAKIAAESMNNYLMFKKRIVAEFVPYEKRPKHLFDGKSTTLTRIPVKIRRSKQFERDNKIDEKRFQKRTKSRLQRLNRSAKVLRNLGINPTFEPADSQVMEKDDLSKNNSLNVNESTNPEVEFSLKPSNKSLVGKKSKSHSDGDSPKVLAKKSSLRSSLKVDSTLKTDKATSTHLPKTKVKKAKKSEGIVKKSKKPLVLNNQTVKKIARELIRTKGTSLINYVTPRSKVVSNKKSKK